MSDAGKPEVRLMPGLAIVLAPAFITMVVGSLVHDRGLWWWWVPSAAYLCVLLLLVGWANFYD